MKQPTLFNETGATNAYGTAITARDEGERQAEVCASKAERQGWDRKGAAQFVLDYLAKHGATAGEVIVTEGSKVHTPHDQRSWGAVFLKLSRAGLIVKAGYTQRAHGHGAPGLVWELNHDRRN